MCGIADQCHTVGDKAVRQCQSQWVAETRPGQADLSQKAAECRAQRGQKLSVAHRHQFCGTCLGFAPDDGSAVIGEGQNGQWPGGHKELMRDAAMRLFMFHRTDDRRLPVAPASALDPGPFGCAAFAPVRPDQQFAGDLPTRRERHGRASHAHRLRHDRFARQMRDSLFFLHRFKEGPPKMPVFDHVAHRSFLDFGVIEVHHPGRRTFARAPVGYLDLKHRLGLVADHRPGADPAQKPHRGKGERVAPPVEIDPLAGVQWQAVDDSDSKPGLCRSQCQCRAIHPAAHDDQIAIHTVQYGQSNGIVHAPLGRYRRGKRGDGMQDWRWMTAADLGRGIGVGEIDPVVLTDVYLDAIDAHEFRDRIYARVTPERARAEAQAAADRAKAGMRRSALDGVPVSWKDLFDTAGVGTEAGTALMAGRVPDTDAEVLKAATAAGLVCLGKTHMSEIAFSGLGLNPITATPPCVNDHTAVPGGSSSGAGASVAFGLAAAGIGSDTGGSVRIPSAWNDLVGLKTTHGQLSLEGVVPLCLTFDTVGPLCRSVEDANLLLAALKGGTPADLAGNSLEGARLMVLDTIVPDDVRDAPRAAFESAVVRLQAAGAQVEHRYFSQLFDAFNVAGNLYAADSYGWWRDLVEASPEKMFPQILERVRGGRTVSGPDYCAGWNMLRDIRKQYAAETAQFDAVIMPTAPILPPNAERLLNDDAYYKAENLLALRNTRVANLMDVCSITLPTGVPSCGIMFNGQNGSEEALLRLAVAAERALS